MYYKQKLNRKSQQKTKNNNDNNVLFSSGVRPKAPPVPGDWVRLGDREHGAKGLCQERALVTGLEAAHVAKG